MWILKLTLTTLWMAGMVADATFGGLLHLLALAAVALVLTEETPLDLRLHPFHFTLPRARHESSPHSAPVAR